MTTPRDFDAAQREHSAAPGDPLSFILNGRQWTVTDLVPAGAVFTLTDALTEDADLRTQLAGYRDFLDVAVDFGDEAAGDDAPDLRAEWAEALTASDIRIVIEVGKYVVQQVLARPFTQPETSTG